MADIACLTGKCVRGVGLLFLDYIPILSEPKSWACNANQAIVFYPARYPELRAVTDLLHSHRLGAASQVGHIIGIPRSVCGHDDIAFDSLTGSYWLIQRTIEAVLVDVSGYRAEWVPRAFEYEIDGPVKRCPGISAPLRDEQATRSVEQPRVCITSICWREIDIRIAEAFVHFSCHTFMY